MFSPTQQSQKTQATFCTWPWARAVAAALLALAAGAAMAQTEKSIVPEAVPAFPAFANWVNVYAPVRANPVQVAVEPVLLNVALQEPGQDYQPQPVILGLPDVPLLGSSVRATARGWGAALNYQGMQLRMLVLNASGGNPQVRSMAGPLRPGELFKIRVTPTFDAVAEIDQMVNEGNSWSATRTGQVYPQSGMSVQIMAGETVDLPLEPQAYFRMGSEGLDRLVLSVRHASALGEARSSQPAYRQDSPSGSGYLQLVPAGTYPALEQLISYAP
ncbi:MAG: hypothetical protein IPH35_10605 [Rhodoferax sp.]|nr:hypothetical protein [Rhodoferax sp.]